MILDEVGLNLAVGFNPTKKLLVTGVVDIACFMEPKKPLTIYFLAFQQFIHPFCYFCLGFRKT